MAVKPGSDGGSGPWTVMVDDNFHFMDESERYELGTFVSWEEGVSACKKIVDEFLATQLKPGMSPEQLFAQYKSFGEDPFIVGDSAEARFSAWDYAQSRCETLCGNVTGAAMKSPTPSPKAYMDLDEIDNQVMYREMPRLAKKYGLKIPKGWPVAFATRPQPQSNIPVNRLQGGVPSVGQAPRAPRADRLEDVSEVLRSITGASVRQGRLARAPKGKVAGQYDRDQGVIRLREASDFETQAHETGHSLETQWGRSLNTIKLAHRAELEPLAYGGADPSQIVSEGFAEWFRLYVTTPGYAQKHAPGFTAAFETMMAGDVDQLAKIKNAQSRYIRWTQTPSGAVVAAAIVSSRREGMISEAMATSSSTTPEPQKAFRDFEAEENGISETAFARRIRKESAVKYGSEVGAGSATRPQGPIYKGFLIVCVLGFIGVVFWIDLVVLFPFYGAIGPWVGTWIGFALLAAAGGVVVKFEKAPNVIIALGLASLALLYVKMSIRGDTKWKL